jgi:hypothetical protein
VTQPPAVLVDPPVITPAQFGLLSVVQFPAPGDAHWPIGVMFEEHGAAQAFAADGWCPVPLTSVITASPGVGQVQTVTLTGPPTAGDFTLTGGLHGTGTTAPIAFNAAAAAVQTAVRALPGFQDAVVAGNAAGPYAITLPAEAGSPAVLTVDVTHLTGGANVAITTANKAPGNTTTDAGVPFGQSAVVTVFAVFDCSAVGRDVNAAAQLAKMKLDYAAPRALEHAIWTGKDSAGASITGQALASTDTDDLSGGAAVDPVKALGRLEKWIGDNYAGQGVVHAPRDVSATFDRFQLHSTSGGKKVTGLGTAVALGQGYDGSGPDGTAAPGDQSWLYATPAVMVRQGDDVLVPDTEHALNRSSNGLVMAAQRQYLAAWETGAAAVLATLGA